MVANGCTDLGGSTQHAISPNAMQSYHKTFKITQTEYVCVCVCMCVLIYVRDA